MGDQVDLGAEVALHHGDDDSLPIFDVQRVDMQFSVAADFVAAQAANNTLILALQTGRIMRVDLDNAEEIDGVSYCSISS